MKTWKTIDKSDWEEGKWVEEPDKAQWIDEATRLDCLIVRGGGGALCGYVGVPEAHRFFEVDYDKVHDKLEELEVHGGLTFSDRCRPSEDESEGICHAGSIANKTVWWLGFDCGHSGDVSPKYDHGFYDPMSSYRSFDYVKREVSNLAAQVV